MINKSILVLEENSVVHGLIASALDVDGLTLHHEFNPAKYVDRARALRPDLILVSNADQFNNYSICRQLKTGVGGEAPLVLLANSRDALDPARLRDLKVDGVVRKPFEASDLQEQVSKHLRLPDLVGAAYEYRQSQSARETMFDPLAQMEVLDEETVTMMKTTGAGAATAVPEVDFSAELSAESASAQSAATEDLMAAGMTETTTVRREETSTFTESRTERTIERMLEGAQSPLPLADFDDSDLAPFPPAEGETLLEASTFEQEDLSQPFPGMRAGEEEPFEELGVEDLLEEESLDEARQLSLEAGAALPEQPLDLQPSPLDQIDVELSPADLTMQAAASLEPEPDDMTLFQQEFESPTAVPSRPVDETIPLAVRRMMEMQPVFKPPSPDTGGGAGRSETVSGETRRTETVRSETVETHRVAAAEPVRAVAPSPEKPWPELAPEETAGAADLDDLRDFDLGDDALDEEQILSAMESEPMGDVEDVEGLEDDALMSLSLEEDEQLASVPEPSAADVELSAPEEDDEEISIDEDEEELILSSLEEEELEERALEAPARGALDLTGPERSGLDEIMAAQEEEEPTAAPLSVADEQEIASMDLDLPTQEATPRDTNLPFPVDELLEVPLTEDLTLESRTVQSTSETTSRTVTTTETRETVVPELPEPPEVAIEFGADDLEADLFSDMDLSSAGDALSAELESAPAPAPAPAASAGEDNEFESAFAALRDEIQSHPEGEHLDDVLRLEGIQNKVARLEFTIPQHESPFARGMGLYAVDGGMPAMDPLAKGSSVPVAVPAAAAATTQDALRQSTVTTERTLHMTTVETRLTQALEGSAAAGSLLDEATKARLSQVLDEIISISVRKAVREEMPRLMQRLAKDSPQA